MTLHHRMFHSDDALPIGDGRSYTEAYRSLNLKQNLGHDTKYSVERVWICPGVVPPASLINLISFSIRFILSAS